MDADLIIATWFAFSILNAGLVFRYIYRETNDAWYSFQVMTNLLPLCMYGPSATLAVAISWLKDRDWTK